jgi:hypothetical protein
LVRGEQWTEEDHALARRRYERFRELTRELEPGSYAFEDILPLLPLDGGAVLACGDTKFEHMQNDTCQNPGATDDKCGRVMYNKKKCVRPLGHARPCFSRDSRDKRRETDRARREKRRVAESGRRTQEAQEVKDGVAGG